MSEFITLATDESFATEVLQASIPVLVDFWAEWCGPCRMLAPTMDELAKEYTGKIKVVKVNVDDCSATASTYSIRSIPTLILFKNGKIVDTKSGQLSKSQLVSFIQGSI